MIYTPGQEKSCFFMNIWIAEITVNAFLIGLFDNEQ